MPKQTPWNPETLALLGTMPDEAIAERLRITRQAVSGMRRKLKISAYKKWPARFGSGKPVRTMDANEYLAAVKEATRATKR